VSKTRVSIKAKLEAMKVKIEERNREKTTPQKAKNKDETL
jgi:hypothetical protein